MLGFDPTCTSIPPHAGHTEKWVPSVSLPERCSPDTAWCCGCCAPRSGPGSHWVSPGSGWWSLSSSGRPLCTSAASPPVCHKQSWCSCILHAIVALEFYLEQELFYKARYQLPLTEWNILRCAFFSCSFFPGLFAVTVYLSSSLLAFMYMLS